MIMPGLRKLTRIHPAMILRVRLRVGVAVDPVAEIAPQFVEIVIPVRPEPERVADKSAHDAARGAVADGLRIHGAGMVTSFSARLISSWTRCLPSFS